MRAAAAALVLLCAGCAGEPELPDVLPEQRPLAARIVKRGGTIRVDQDHHVCELDGDSENGFLITDADLKDIVENWISLEYVCLFGATEVTDDGLKHLANCEQLRILETGFEDEAALEYFGRIRSLSSLGLSGRITGDGLTALSGLVNLESLSLWGGPFSTEALKQLPKLPRLRHLELQIEGRPHPQWSVMRVYEKLDSLHVWGLGYTATASDLRYLSKCRELKRLRLSDLGADTAVLDHLLACSNLREIHTWNTHFDREDVDRILRMPCLNLLEMRVALDETDLVKLRRQHPQFDISLVDRDGPGLPCLVASHKDKPSLSCVFDPQSTVCGIQIEIPQ